MDLPKESKIDSVKKWLGDILNMWAGWNMAHVEEDTGWVEEDGKFEYKFSVKIYTALNVYRVTAIDRAEDCGYLGCIVSVRYPRPGEHWCRGNDLPDGHLKRETWERIKNAMLAYEIVQSDPHQTATTATFEVLTLAIQGVLMAIRQVKVDGYWRSPDFMTGAGMFSGLAGSSPPSPGWKRTIPTAVTERVTDLLRSILEQVPVEMLPELLISKDACVRDAAMRRIALEA